MRFVSVVPAIRTIPGVESFDYSISPEGTLEIGDLIRVPFRNRQIPAIVVGFSDSSQYAAKAKNLEDPQILLRLGPAVVDLLERTSRRTFSSHPSVLLAWLREVPKRFKLPPARASNADQLGISFAKKETRYLADILHAQDGLVPTASSCNGRTLILSAWKNPATSLAAELGCPVLHSDIPAGAAWKILVDFVTSDAHQLVTTKLGAWLACFADTVLIEEPENDDHKQDELAPRIDARWLVAECAKIRPNLSVIGFSLTPGLDVDTPSLPALTPETIFETFSRSGRSSFDGLTASTMNRVEEALVEKRPVTIIHPVRGERARFSCSNCGWTATCPACGYQLGQYGSSGLCRKCGRKSPLPLDCPQCGGTDFSRGRPGLDRLVEQISKMESGSTISIINLTQAQENRFPQTSLVVINDAALLAGAVEDIRRRERLVVAWRRLAAKAQIAGATLVVQAKDEVLALCQRTMSSEGLEEERKLEKNERRLFNFPPASRLVKMLVDGDEHNAAALFKHLTEAFPQDWNISGPFPVPYRSSTRTPRSIIQVTLPLSVSEQDLYAAFDPYKLDAYIDLDPIAFFC
ncbi:hypothetical protein HZC53_06305 [Candidatus Uhrbacteria bacterium]|nr:hypothetical protein [Candidatus Uhrbacteria bacterium]